MFGFPRQQPGDVGRPDLFALPPVPVGDPHGLAAVPADLLGAYLRHPVRSVGPLDLLGPEATGFLGNAIRKRMRERGVAGPSLEHGELVPGQHAARMRAQGMSEEQIEQIEATVAAKAAERQAAGWTVRFTDDTYASVLPQPHGGDGTGFQSMRDRFRRQHTRTESEDLFSHAVEQVPSTPYESYHDGGALTAGGRGHDVAVQSAGLRSGYFVEILAGLAAVTLRVLGS
ncbi:hypothetical protein Dvina_35215 [Dactylosporangium vinaceum]|uniref:Uncharacterized protein n=1 Tax=Dactylosporangium vinaceum TaxID=53362 RepID=A0ABV5M427_9ACTN|nr:hypothetical protein [Dactylosporangium vinaceum]UAB93478.1 hypothetical protein Dvina_35215 [Dactylosporangium vinaceum]